MLFRPEPAHVIVKPNDRERAEWLGLLCQGDIARAIDVEHSYLEPLSRRERIESEIRAAVALAQHAWCFALDATGYRETVCHCRIGGGHRR
jgi:hypothetical protein